MYHYQTYQRYFAQVGEEIKDITEKELSGFGATKIQQVYRGCYFHADLETLYRINYQSRFISRVLAPIIIFDCHSDNYLYKTARDINWSDFMQTSGTFAIHGTVSHSNITHSRFASLRLKDAIVDYFRDSTGNRPSIDTKNPDVWINLHIENNRAVISLDVSGGALHRRGYRQMSVEAPMMETLAAAIVEFTEWDGKEPFFDPFCGSGTLLSEAYLYATQLPPGILRKKFGFQSLPDYRDSTWKSVQRKALDSKTRIDRGLISGSDISPNAIRAAIKNCAVLDPDQAIRITRKDIFESEGFQNGIIVCNPPYGIRMEKDKDLSAFYKSFGDFLKNKCKNSTAFIYFGDRKYIKNIGLKPSWKKPLRNGGLDGRLVKIELY